MSGSGKRRGVEDQERRGTAAQRGYGYKWQQAREVFLRAHPLCRMHADRGELVPATVVDHIVAHRGDRSLFWKRDNWQPLCKACHDGTKQRLERSGVLQGCGADGVPIDPNHHWHKTPRQTG